MLRDITIGQYYEAESMLHRLDPRVKLLGTLVYMIALFVADNIFAYVFCIAFLATLINISNVPVKLIFRGVKTIVFFAVFTAIFSLFFTEGKVLVDLGWIKITIEGIIKTITLVIRLFLLIIGTSIMTYTTTPTDIADGLEKAFSPLKYIKVPVHEIAMMISIAFRFIPILVEETDKIIKAQMARGIDFEGGFIKKIKSVIPLIIPLIISSIKRALDLATAMEARCYRGGEGRTRMKPLRYKKVDFGGYICLLMLPVVVIVTNIIGVGKIL